MRHTYAGEGTKQHPPKSSLEGRTLLKILPASETRGLNEMNLSDLTDLSDLSNLPIRQSLIGYTQHLPVGVAAAVDVPVRAVGGEVPRVSGV